MAGTDELEAFKREIDLRTYAAAHGYELDRRESWRGSAVMRHKGDKIIIKIDGDGHYVYFSVRDDRDHGSIIDFVQNRRKLSLGEVRRELRPWVGKSAAEFPAFTPLEKTAKDRMWVEMAYMKMRPALSHPYLERERGIPAALLNSERFSGTVRIDGRGNAVFPHYDEAGLTGYELKNTGFTGFSTGGIKALWSSRVLSADDKLVLCESAIDALSYALLHPDPHARYASIGGNVNPLQPNLVREAAARLPVGSEVVAAMDADDDGRKLADIVRSAVEATGRPDLLFSIKEPVGYKDYNDQLRGRRNASLSRRAGEPSLA